MKTELIYLSFPILDYGEAPAWTAPLLAAKNLLVYNPRQTFDGNDKRTSGAFTNFLDQAFELPSALMQVLRLSPLMLERYKSFKDPSIFNSNDMFTQVVFRDLYVLMRASMIIADGNHFSSGGTPQEVLYAHLMGKYSVLVSDRSTPGLWMRQHTDVTVDASKAMEAVHMFLFAKQRIAQMEEEAKENETPAEPKDAPAEDAAQ